jgi:hypothetical protein
MPVADSQRDRISGSALRALVLATACLALLSGCGSYTKQDFIDRADAICAAAQHQIREVTPPADTSLTALTGFLAQVLPIAQKESRQLHALKRPGGGRPRDPQRLTRFLAAEAAAVSGYARLLDAAHSGDARRVADVESALAENRSTALAAAYGLRDCGAPRATVS